VTTFLDLTNRAHSLLHSSTGVQEQVTWLTSSATASALTLSVNDSSAVSNGISEVGDELVYVSSSDSDTLAIAPFGRGFRGSTAASHAVNTQVTFNPTFPRVEIKKAINDALRQTYPSLWQVKSTTFTFTGAQLTYELPADCDAVTKVLWETVGPSHYWETSYGWRFEPDSEEATGKALTLLDMPLQGQTVKVVYQASFSALADDADTLEGTGFPASAEDVLLYAVAAKLIRFIDVSRMQLDSVENLSRAAVVQAGDAGKVANQMYAMYQQRLAEERSRLLTLNPPQLYFTR
jgi:hypothetical protein